MTASSAAPEPGFSAVAARLEGVEGWLTLDQAEVLYDAARALVGGQRAVEIGSFRGRSTTVLGLAAAPGVEVVAIDPHAGNDRGPNELDGFAAAAARDHDVFCANLARAGLAGRVRYLRSFSQDALAELDGDVDVLFIDGAHRYRPALADIEAWGQRVPASGVMLIHDAFSSIGVTLAIGRALLASRRFRYAGRTGSLAVYRAETVEGARPRLANAGHQLAQLPWFGRNLVVKALIATGFAGLARRLGHREATWPY
jgi:predicted O-methyltransferase YrrM